MFWNKQKLILFQIIMAPSHNILNWNTLPQCASGNVMVNKLDE